MHAAAAKELAARLTEASPTRTVGFDAYFAQHRGAPLRHAAGATDRHLREVAAALGVHLLDAVALHARWVGKVLAAHPGLVGSDPFVRDWAESYVARVMAERAGLLEARPVTLELARAA